MQRFDNRCTYTHLASVAYVGLIFENVINSFPFVATTIIDIINIAITIKNIISMSNAIPRSINCTCHTLDVLVFRVKA